MKTVKEVLENQRKELYQEIESIESKHKETLSQATHDLVDSLDETFKEFTIDISSDSISFNLDGSSWDRFRISRRNNYNGEYGKAELSMSSIHTEKDSDLKVLICIGKLAEHRMKETPIWKDLNGLMNAKSYFYKEEISEKRKLIWDIENEINKIERQEYEDKINSLFSKNEINLKDTYRFYYGNGKWDYVISANFKWEQNPSGKTYKLSYKDGDNFREINKRIKLNDIRSLVRSNINNAI